MYSKLDGSKTYNMWKNDFQTVVAENLLPCWMVSFEIHTSLLFPFFSLNSGLKLHVILLVSQITVHVPTVVCTV